MSLRLPRAVFSPILTAPPFTAAPFVTVALSSPGNIIAALGSTRTQRRHHSASFSLPFLRSEKRNSNSAFQGYREVVALGNHFAEEKKECGGGFERRD
ncbi:lipase [Sesbania bispinosa]|nr:lipase [Sesbania bispinosa]